MHVIVMGAGEVGSYVADRLSREGHDVAVIEQDPTRRRELEENLDVLTLLGSGTDPAVLREAGSDRASLLVAVTTNDEANLIASCLAKQHGVARTIVRIEAASLRGLESEALREAMGVDLVIDPDEETAHEILDLLDYPGASDVAKMADGEVVVIGARLGATAPLVGKTLSQIASEFEPNWDFLVGAITRGGETIIPRGNQRLEANDLLRIVCKRRARALISRLLGLAREVPHRVMLLGGGRTARILAGDLDNRGVQVVLVERDPARARELAERLDHALVLHGDITDADLLEEADIGSFDIVVALTGEDDANVLACLYAKAAGASETIAVVHRLSLLDLLEQLGVDVALSPRTASANGVLRFVRGDVTAVATFLQGDAEVLEFVVKPGSQADGHAIAELALPKAVLIGAIVRDGVSEIARGRTELLADDHVIVFAKPQSVDAVATLFG